jgi:hypothetical protein
MINHMTREPILPARTADQYLARYWSAVCAGKIGSPVRRFISSVVAPPLHDPSHHDMCLLTLVLIYFAHWMGSV